MFEKNIKAKNLNINSKMDIYQAGAHSNKVSKDISTVKGCIVSNKNRNSINLSMNNVMYVLQLRYNFLSVIDLWFLVFNSSDG